MVGFKRWVGGAGVGRRMAAAVGLLVASLAPAAAETVTVFAAGAVKHAVQAAQTPFERASGHRLEVVVDTVGALRDRVLAGERPDVVILSQAGIAALVSADRAREGNASDLGAIAVAFAVRRGAAVPDVSTAGKLADALRAAPAIAWGSAARGATAGTHFERTIDRLGLGDVVRAKGQVMPSGIEAIDAVAQGRVALGVSQASEIPPVSGVALVGPLPPEYRLETRYAAAAITERPAARDFVGFLASPDGRRLLREVGFSD